MDELVKKLNQLLTAFNSSFELKAEKTNIDGEEVVCDLFINKINTDGKEFVNELFDMINQILESTNEYELRYDDSNGLVIVKEVVKEVVSFEKV